MIILNNQFEGTSMQFQQRNVVFYGNYVIKKKKKQVKRDRWEQFRDF